MKGKLLFLTLAIFLFGSRSQAENSTQLDKTFWGQKDGIQIETYSPGWVFYLLNNSNEPLEINGTTERFYYFIGEKKYQIHMNADSPAMLLNPSVNDMFYSDDPTIQENFKNNRIKKFLVSLNYGQTEIELHPTLGYRLRDIFVQQGKKWQKS